jgi:tellurite resistance protein TerC
MMLWITFFVFVVAMLALDLGVFHRRSRVIHMREAVVWTAVWIGLALLFNAGIFFYFGLKAGLEFLSAYIVEKSLSIDNAFVFLLIFSYFNTALGLQHNSILGNRWGHSPHRRESIR